MNWQRPILTDSGGFQVFSLAGTFRPGDEGVSFRSIVDGAWHSWTPEDNVAIQEALDRLMQGNARYVAGETECKDYSIGRAERAGAQYPLVAVLSCSDSRVSPELLFEQGPGDIFVVRIAGNFVNTDGLASMEYAVKVLGVPLLMVLGHSNCGAVAAAIKVVTEHAELPGPSAGVGRVDRARGDRRTRETSERSRRRHH